jgi:hypothetical protein
LTENAGRYALIVAESDYVDPKLRKLRAPAADAERLSAVLKNPDIGGFEVEQMLNPGDSELKRKIARFFSNRLPDDLLLVHFSCHGLKDDRGELYIAATDTEVGDMLGATGTSAAWLSDQIGHSRSKRVVVLLDCCFSGSFPFGVRSRAGEDVNVRDYLDGRGRAVITASSAMEYSYEGDQLHGHGQPSVFTSAVVEGLESGKADRDGDKWISVDDLYDYVYDRVKENTPSQSPNKLSTLEGPLRLARSVYEPPVAPAELNQRLLDLTEDPLAAARLGAVDELTTLLTSLNKGIALAARLELERMQGDDSEKVRKRACNALAPLASDAETPRQSEARDPAQRERVEREGAERAADEAAKRDAAERPSVREWLRSRAEMERREREARGEARNAAHRERVEREAAERAAREAAKPEAAERPSVRAWLRRRAEMERAERVERRQRK